MLSLLLCFALTVAVALAVAVAFALVFAVAFALVFAVAFALVVGPGFSPDINSPLKFLPYCRRPERRQSRSDPNARAAQRHKPESPKNPVKPPTPIKIQPQSDNHLNQNHLPH
jgi:hypothetical protein